MMKSAKELNRPPKEKEPLREFAARDLFSGALFVKVIAFRRGVLKEFDRLSARRWPRQKRGSPGIRNELKPRAQIK